MDVHDFFLEVKDLEGGRRRDPGNERSHEPDARFRKLQRGDQREGPGDRFDREYPHSRWGEHLQRRDHDRLRDAAGQE